MLFGNHGIIRCNGLFRNARINDNTPMTNCRQNDFPNEKWNILCRIGGITALMQVITPLFTMAVIFTQGGEPNSAKECFTIIQ